MTRKVALVQAAWGLDCCCYLLLLLKVADLRFEVLDVRGHRDV